MLLNIASPSYRFQRASHGKPLRSCAVQRRSHCVLASFLRVRAFAICSREIGKRALGAPAASAACAVRRLHHFSKLPPPGRWQASGVVTRAGGMLRTVTCGSCEGPYFRRARPPGNAAASRTGSAFPRASMTMLAGLLGHVRADRSPGAQALRARRRRMRWLANRQLLEIHEGAPSRRRAERTAQRRLRGGIALDLARRKPATRAATTHAARSRPPSVAGQRGECDRRPHAGGWPRPARPA